jgi:hypothetical protein
VSLPDLTDRLVAAYRRERLSFLQYIRQATPYAGPADRVVAARVHELAEAEAATLDAFGEFLDRQRITVPYLGAFPTSFTNYNFIAVRKLLPSLIADEDRGLKALEADIAALDPGEARSWLEKLADGKRMHGIELGKLREPVVASEPHPVP